MIYVVFTSYGYYVLSWVFDRAIEEWKDMKFAIFLLVLWLILGELLKYLLKLNNLSIRCEIENFVFVMLSLLND